MVRLENTFVEKRRKSDVKVSVWNSFSSLHCRELRRPWTAMFLVNVVATTATDGRRTECVEMALSDPFVIYEHIMGKGLFPFCVCETDHRISPTREVDAWQLIF